MEHVAYFQLLPFQKLAIDGSLEKFTSNSYFSLWGPIFKSVINGLGDQNW